MVARVAPQKDYATLIRAAEIVVRRVPEARFVVVGDYDSVEVHRKHFAEVQALLRVHGVEHAFYFAGHQTDVEAWLAALDVFVLSTHWEGFPLVILEAMAHGLPVIATAVDGIPEIIDDSRNGLLAPAGDAERLAGGLIQTLTDQPFAQRIGAQAHQTIVNDFSEAAYRARVGELYRAVLGGGDA
jgi:glycosyltransferase involved in cell wall biosynthesis